VSLAELVLSAEPDELLVVESTEASSLGFVAFGASSSASLVFPLAGADVAGAEVASAALEDGSLGFESSFVFAGASVELPFDSSLWLFSVSVESELDSGVLLGVSFDSLPWLLLVLP
jgi:hypothetical protein